MKKKKNDVLVLSQMALMIALMLVLSFTPLGYIPLGVITPTTMHIPVIIGACLLGPKMGGILGGVFGITSLLKSTFQPTLMSFAFSPFYSVGGISGNGWSVLVAIVPRVLIGIVAGFLFRFLQRTKLPDTISLAITGLVGSLVNTIGVMGLIYKLFGTQFAAAQGIGIDALFAAISAIVIGSGIPEALVAAVLTAAVGKALLVFFTKQGARSARNPL